MIGIIYTFPTSIATLKLKKSNFSQCLYKDSNHQFKFLVSITKPPFEVRLKIHYMHEFLFTIKWKRCQNGIGEN